MAVNHGVSPRSQPAWLTLACLLGACGDSDHAARQGQAGAPVALVARRSPAGIPGPRVHDRVTPVADPAAEFFAGGRVHRIDLTIERAAMADLARRPDHYVEAVLRVGDVRLDHVAVRIKGNRSLRGWSDKPAFKLRFDKRFPAQRLHGMRALVLNNLVEDPTMMREHLAYKVFRAASIAAPRTAHAELYINDQPRGLYLVLESLGEALLSRGQGAGNGSGPLYEGEFGCDVYPGDVHGLEYKRGADPGRRLLQRFVEGLSIEAPLAVGSGAGIDRPALLTYLAISTLIGDFDGYRHGHNYLLYMQPDTRLWSLLPWGLDRTFSTRMPIYDSHGRLAKLCFADAGCRLDYVRALHREADRFEAMQLDVEIDRLEALLADAVDRDVRRPHSDSKLRRRRLRLRGFIAERPAEVRAEAACWDGQAELDADGDGFGCMDCDDADPTVHPGAPQLCVGRDDDCNGLVDDAPACPCRRITRGGIEFALCDFPIAFDRARDACRGRAGTLAQPSSAAQARVLYEAAGAIRGDDWWIGLSDRGREGDHRFLDGARVSFDGWARGEPDDHACGQHCAALGEGQGGRFVDLHCAEQRPFICALAR